MVMTWQSHASDAGASGGVRVRVRVAGRRAELWRQAVDGHLSSADGEGAGRVGPGAQRARHAQREPQELRARGGGEGVRGA